MSVYKRSRTQSERTGGREALLCGLSRAREELAVAHRRFEQAQDPELIEASIFEMRALQARCAWLLRQLREGKE